MLSLTHYQLSCLAWCTPTTCPPSEFSAVSSRALPRRLAAHASISCVLTVPPPPIPLLSLPNPEMCGLPAFPPESVQRPLSLPLVFQFPWSLLRSFLSCGRSRPALPRRAGGLGFPPPALPRCPAADSSWRWTCCLSGFHDTALSHVSPLGSDSSSPPWHLLLPASLVGVPEGCP